MKRIRKYRWYHPAYYAKLERWLSEMSEQGLRLCRYDAFGMNLSPKHRSNVIILRIAAGWEIGAETENTIS